MALKLLLGTLQIRAGTGGEEAALFAAELLRMYQKYADLQNWKLSRVSESEADNGGLKEAFIEVTPPAGLCLYLLFCYHFVDKGSRTQSVMVEAVGLAYVLHRRHIFRKAVCKGRMLSHQQGEGPY